jgi:hypothetical protein
MPNLYKCSSCGHAVAATARFCPGCKTPGPIARHPNSWRTAEPPEAIADLLAAEQRTTAMPATYQKASSTLGSVSRAGSSKFGKIARGSAYVAAALFALVVLVAVFGNKESSSPSATKESAADTDQSPAARSAAAPAPDSGPTHKQIGQTFRLGDDEYVIKTLQLRTGIGGEFTHKVADPGTAFLIVFYDLTNRGNTTQTVIANDFQFVSPDGKTYEPDSEAQTIYIMNGAADLALSQLQPDVTKHSVVVFRVPQAAVHGKTYLKVPEKGFLSNGETIVDLTE